MHAHYSSLLLALLAERGISEQQLIDRAGLEPGQLFDAPGVDAIHFDAVCRAAVELSGDLQLGLRMGAKINVPSQGIFGFALMSCATAGEALKLMVRYNRVISPSTRIELKQVGSGAELIMRAAHLPANLENFYCEVMFAGVVNSGLILVGEQRGNILVELDYEPAENQSLYRKVLGDSVRFNSGRKAICFDEKSLAADISTANTIAGDIFRAECDRLFSPNSHRGAVSDRVQQILIQSGSNFPTCAAMASKLHMSESTLQRRLGNEGWRYQHLLDQVRFRLAREYLAGTSLAVSEIADLLGFSDATNFRRSFKRWSQTTPSQFRTDNLAVPSPTQNVSGSSAILRLPDEPKYH
jgi:AraC-like DNA-binding protein